MKLEERKLIRLFQHTDKELITYTNKAIETNDIDRINAVIRTIKDFRKQTPKTIEFGNEIITNIAKSIKGKNFFNEKLELNESYILLKGYEELLLKNICSKNYQFTEEQIKYIPNKNILYILNCYKEDALTVNNILKEINKRFKNKNINFNSESSDNLYNYIYLLNKYKYIKELELCIQDKQFLKAIENSDIAGSLLLNAIQNCSTKSKEKLFETKKVKNSLKGKDPLFDSYTIINELNKEEIELCFKDMSVSNYIITNGIAFDKIPNDKKEQITEDLNNFKFYKGQTVIDLIDNHPSIQELSKNIEVLFIYLNNIQKEYEKHKILKMLDKTTYKKILSDERFNKLSDTSIMALIANLPEVQKKDFILNERTIKAISKNLNEEIIEIIPENILKDLMIKNNKKLTIKDFNIINKLSKKDIKSIFENNDNAYECLINVLEKEKNIDLSNTISALPENILRDLSFTKIETININAFNNLMIANKAYFKKALLEQEGLSKKVISNLNKNTVSTFIELIENAKYKDSEILTIIKDVESINEPVLVPIFNSLSASNRQRLFENKKIKKHLLSNEKLEFEKFMLDYFIINQKEISELSPSLIIKLLSLIDENVRKKIMTNKAIITKILDYGISPLKLIKIDINYLTILTDDEYIKYFDRNKFQEVYNYLSYENKLELCNNNKLIKHIIKDDNIYKVYQNLITKDKKILNTLNFAFLNENTYKMKLNDLLIIVKNPKIQQLYLTINEKYPLNNTFMTNLMNNIKEMDISKVLYELLLIINKSVQGENRKQIGNIANLIGNKTLTSTEFKCIVEYLLYFVPRYNLISRPKFKETPKTFDELLNYTNNINKELNMLIKESSGIKLKEYYLLYNYKLTYNEAKEFIRTYSIERLDEKVYSEEIKYYLEIKNILNSSDDKLKTNKQNSISMIDSFIKEYKFKNIYNVIYNYELLKNAKINKKTQIKLYNKHIDVYNSFEDYMYMTSNISLKNEKNISYKDLWESKLNKLSFIDTSIISSDNLMIQNKKEILYGFNKIGSIIDVDPYLYLNSNNSYQTPREIIDNTRYNKNEILIDKYLDGNYIEPNYILIFEETLYKNGELNILYLEQAYKMSIDFKSKSNPKGLPIVLIDISKTKENEINKIKYNLDRYSKNHDVALLANTLTKYNNNCNGYKVTNKKMLEELLSIPLEDEIHTRIKNSNSISELEYIKTIIEIEQEKFKSYKSFIDYKLIIKNINNRISKIK